MGNAAPADASASRVPDAWPSLMRGPVAAAYVGVSLRWLEMAAASGRAPKPVHLPGANIRAWKRSDLDAWVEGLG